MAVLNLPERVQETAGKNDVVIKRNNASKACNISEACNRQDAWIESAIRNLGISR